ncbi:transcription elongation factor GreA [Brockia lithotrophica]|uniref:Transcription elongation factor GreA n=1 Tax=Brockia lithotrophica TaxID=933949 RepID=A0A660KW49_9BACL|nr:transcription elongation factor GreA [Brockia lithotrophica]RKQ85612.1 transcription elongation factor GreA [Brockia lithotrophica]
MADKEFFLTPEGYRKLEEELEFLKNVKRKEIAEKIKIAISYGDLSENSEYEEAKNEQAFIEGRILELEKMLRNARIIENGGDFNVIHVGSTVLVRDLEFDEVLEFTIVGSAEADPSEHRISNESPVGRALLGRRPGEIVEVSAPAGVIRYEILEIKRDGAA